MKDINQSSVNQSKGFSINASDFAKVLKENNIKFRRGLIEKSFIDSLNFLVIGCTIEIEKEIVWDKSKLDINKDFIIRLLLEIEPILKENSIDDFSESDRKCISTLNSLVKAADIQEEDISLKRKK